MADPALLVFHEGRLVGKLSPEPLEFRYDKKWLEHRAAFPISVSLPLRAETFGEAAVRAFFFNLLPEGNIRRRLAGRLGLSEGNDYALLAAIGGECAGALSVSKSAAEAKKDEAYLPLSDEEIAKRIASGALSSVAGEEGVRLSLAGAQDKLPVLIEDGTVFLPKGSAASSHILKLDSSDFKHLPANEVLMLRLAAAVGLTVVNAELRRFGRWTVAVIERYDRERKNARVTRLHQEDFCQALGVAAEKKYETEGGPSFARCVELVRSVSADPLADSNLLIRWQMFNAAAGNADGHAKNLALLHLPSGTRLAPFYDLVSTRAYPRVERRLAMRFGENADPDRLGKKDWALFAERLQAGERFLRQTAEELAEGIDAALDPTLRDVERAFGRKEFLRSAVVPAIRAANRRFVLSLRAKT